MNQPQLLQNLTYRIAYSEDGCKGEMQKAVSEALQNSKLSHPGFLSQQRSHGQDLTGGQYLNSQRVLGSSVEVPEESYKHHIHLMVPTDPLQQCWKRPARGVDKRLSVACFFI